MTAARVAGQSRVLFVPSSVLTSVRKARGRLSESGSSSSRRRRRCPGSRSAGGRGAWCSRGAKGSGGSPQPFSDLADAAAADRLVDELTALRARDFIHSNEDLAALSLSPPLYRVSLTGEKGVVTSVDFGATRSDGDTVYARRDGQVLTVERDIVDELSKEAEPFRSTTLVAFDRGEVAAVDARFGEESFALAQEAGGWSAGGRPVLAAAADDVLRGARGPQEPGVHRRDGGQGARARDGDRGHQEQDRGGRGLDDRLPSPRDGHGRARLGAARRLRRPQGCRRGAPGGVPQGRDAADALTPTKKPEAQDSLAAVRSGAGPSSRPRPRARRCASGAWLPCRPPPSSSSPWPWRRTSRTRRAGPFPWAASPAAPSPPRTWSS